MLDSTEWATLTHAYGDGMDIVVLLRDLESDPGAPSSQRPGNVWFELWSSLCHQGTIYTASYASVPHIVRIAWQALGSPEIELPFDYFLLPACIDFSRQADREAPQMPAPLAEPYGIAMAELHDLAHAMRERPWSEDIACSIAAALMIEKGALNPADAILNSNPVELKAARELLREFDIDELRDAVEHAKKSGWQEARKVWRLPEKTGDGPK